jgi:hypothetical protein
MCQEEFSGYSRSVTITGPFDFAGKTGSRSRPDKVTLEYTAAPLRKGRLENNLLEKPSR